MAVRTGFLLLATLIMVPSTGSAQWTNRYPMVRGHSHHVYLEGYELPALTAGPIDPAPSPDGTEADFERNKNQLQNFLTKSLRSANDEELAKQSLEWVMYEGHPYRHPVQGTVQGVESITLDDVKAFYHERYTFENLQIGLAGDFPESFPERVREDFKKALPSGATKAAALPKVSSATRGKGLDVTIVERDGADSTAVSLGFPLDITRASDDFYPLLVANIYLGDHRSFNGVLMNELRAKRGLNYGDYSYIENFIQDGGSTFPVPNVPRRQQYFSIWIRPVAPENAHFALRGAIFYLRRLVEDGMSNEDFEGMRDYIMSYSKLWAQNLDRRLGYELDSSFYQTGSYIQEIENRLRSMTAADVNRAAKKYLDRWDFDVAMVAASTGPLAEAVRGNAKSPISYQTPGTAKEVLVEDKKIEVLELPIDNVRVIPVAEFFEK